MDNQVQFESADQALKLFEEKFGNINVDKIELDERYKPLENDEEFKKSKKRVKKYQLAIGKQDDALNEKIQKLIKDTRQSEEEYQASINVFNSTDKEHTNTESEYAKQLKSKQMLESLYQDFHKKYNEACEKHQKQAEEEKDKRQKLAESFQDRIKGIQTSVDAQTKIRVEIQQEHETLKEKLNAVNKQYETRELLFETELKKKEIEMQLSETQFKQQLTMLEKQTSVGTEMTEEIAKLEEIDRKLQEKLETYEAKNNEFTSILTQTNENFGKYKQQMEMLQLSIAKFDKENMTLKEKSVKTSKYLNNMINENQSLKKEKVSQEQQLSTLKGLLDMVEKDLQKKKEAQ